MANAQIERRQVTELPIIATCRCGATEFISRAAPVLEARCHCSDCRSVSGEASIATAFFRTETAEIRGEVDAVEFVSEAGNRTSRDKCRECGSMMFDRSDGFAGLIGVVADRIAPPFASKTSCHMWYASRIEDAPDSLPKFDKGIR